MASNGGSHTAQQAQAQIQPCRYKTGKTLGAGSYSVVKECVHIDTGRYYAAKVINKRLMAGREHMVSTISYLHCYNQSGEYTNVQTKRSGTRSQFSRKSPWATGIY
jgi:serine/threonine protein kinase